MLIFSYSVAAVAMSVTAIYLVLRLRLFVTTTTLFVGGLLLIYGPLLLTYTISSGAYCYLIRRLTDAPLLFSTVMTNLGDANAVVIPINFSVALMYLGVIGGIESVNRLGPSRAAVAETSMARWSRQALSDDVHHHRWLLFVSIALFLFMLFVSINENHVQTIAHFFSISDDNTARNLYRAHFGGSPDYLYRLVLGAVAPMFVIWDLLAGARSRSWSLLAIAVLLFLVTMLGRTETLSKGPPMFFLLQIMLAVLLVFTNRISWRLGVGTAIALAVMIYVTTRLIVILPENTAVMEVAYHRVFEEESETLVENFAFFPHLHPFMWGANMRPIAALMGVPYVPAFEMVGSHYGGLGTTSPSLFIADAWADFSYVGVLVFSIVAGAVCRTIDFVALAQGKSAVSIAVLAATFSGVLTLLTTALGTALFSGGLLLAPLLAALITAASRRSSRN